MIAKTTTTACFVLAMGCSFMGCSLIADVDRVQCETNADCTAIATGANTECIDSICTAIEVGDLKFGCREEPWITLDNNAKVPVVFSPVALSDSNPVVGLEIRQCNSLFDRECENPITVGMTDSEGKLTIDTPQGFRGHFFAPTQLGFAAQILHVFPPPDPAQAWTLDNPMFMANLSEIAAAGAIVGVTVLPGTGVYFFTTRDCSGAILPDVVVTVSPSMDETAITYLSSSNLPDTTLDATGISGLGAMVNIPPGNATIKGVHKEFGVIFEQVVIVTADTITAGTIVPAP